MSVLEAILLGVVQGLCEFLPVSSSGHLLIVSGLLGLETPGLLLEVALHGGTLIAVCIHFWRDILHMVLHPVKDKTLRLLVVATLPAVVATLVLGDLLDAIFSGALLGVSFLLTTAVLWFSSVYKGEKKELSYEEAGIMGAAQGFALLPGLSRSGTTISGGLIAGVEKESAARFSFLMSIPAILGALVFQIKDIITEGIPASLPALPLLVGIAVAALSGLFAIRFMMELIKRAKLKWFGVYTLALGILVLLDQFVFHIVF